MNQDFRFFGDECRQFKSPSPIQKRKIPSILKDDFSSRIDPFTFTPTPPESLDRSNRASLFSRALKSTFNFLLHYALSHRSDSSSEAQSRVESSIISIVSKIKNNTITKVQDQQWSLEELQYQLDILVKTSNLEPIVAIYYLVNTK